MNKHWSLLFAMIMILAGFIGHVDWRSAVCWGVAVLCLVDVLVRREDESGD